MNRIIQVKLPYKKPALAKKGSKSIWITWSKAVRSNSFMESIWANAFLPIYWMLFDRTILDFALEQHSKANSPMYSTPSSKLMLIISLLVNDKLEKLP
ncbi:MAG: hypothetical protein PUB26_03890 [Mycoplasmataceae bacterium]|nr:hypothetical protein [Mycoplasmataceae bacterium]